MKYRKPYYTYLGNMEMIKEVGDMYIKDGYDMKDVCEKYNINEDICKAVIIKYRRIKEKESKNYKDIREILKPAIGERLIKDNSPRVYMVEYICNFCKRKCCISIDEVKKLYKSIGFVERRNKLYLTINGKFNKFYFYKFGFDEYDLLGKVLSDLRDKE